MEFAPAGVPLSFEVTFDALVDHPGMTVFDDSGVSPVVDLATFAMTHVVGYTYRGKFTAVAGKSYIVIKAAYTDGTFNTYDPEHQPESESIVAQYLNNPSAQNVVGVVVENDPLTGVVECN